MVKRGNALQSASNSSITEIGSDSLSLWFAEWNYLDWRNYTTEHVFIFGFCSSNV